MLDIENKTACDEFLKRSMQRVLRLAKSELRITGCTDWTGHADEVVNEVSLKILLKWLTLRSPDDALHTITVNAARTHASKCRRESPQEIDDSAIPSFTSGPLDPAAIYDAGIYLDELSSQVAEIDQTIMNYLYQGYTYEEISAILDMPSNTIRSRFSRASKKLRQLDSQAIDAELSSVTTD